MPLFPFILYIIDKVFLLPQIVHKLVILFFNPMHKV